VTLKVVARRAVVLSAGSLHSPCILLRSGLGDHCPQSPLAPPLGQIEVDKRKKKKKQKAKQKVKKQHGGQGATMTSTASPTTTTTTMRRKRSWTNTHTTNNGVMGRCNAHIGRHLKLHPVTAAIGRFPKLGAKCFRGAPMTSVSDHGE
jgi:hypothetical protein